MIGIDALTEACAIVAAMIFAALSIFQIFLASGAPLGEYSWGGKYKGKLPPRMRIASAFAVPILLFAAYVILGRAKLIDVGMNYMMLGVLSWFFTAYLALNILGNLNSESRKERMIMGPVSIVAFLCCLMVSAFGSALN